MIAPYSIQLNLWSIVFALIRKSQRMENDVPCCFFTDKFKLQPGETYTIYELYGQTENIDNLSLLYEKVLKKDISKINMKKQGHYHGRLQKRFILKPVTRSLIYIVDRPI